MNAFGRFLRPLMLRRQAASIQRRPAPTANREQGDFPASAGILFGLGIGGFFDGIILHQVLQWHHMLTSAGYPPDTLRNLEINTLADGLFHVTTYIFVVAGMIILWRHAQNVHVRWSTKLIVGTLLMGFGIFNLVEGIVDHQILGLHHVNETVPRDEWIDWDMGFLVWGAVMLVVGWYLKRSGRAATDDARSVERRLVPEQAHAGGRRHYDPPLARPAT
jgi:uncharacterized membrane protein